MIRRCICGVFHVGVHVPKYAAIERLAKQFADKKISRQEFMDELETLESAPLPVPSHKPQPISAERLEQILDMLPSLRETLIVGEALEPTAANKVVREMFRVIVLEGHIARIEVLGTEGKVIL